MNKNKQVTKRKLNKNKEVAKPVIDIENTIKDTDKPVFLFDCLDKNGKFAFRLDRKDFDAKSILQKIINYSNMTWREIRGQTHDNGKSKHHSISDITRLSDEATNRLEAMEKEDEADSLFSFAFTNLIRLWCLKKGKYFHILWYDSKHEVYPTKK